MLFHIGIAGDGERCFRLLLDTESKSLKVQFDLGYSVSDFDSCYHEIVEVFAEPYDPAHGTNHIATSAASTTRSVGRRIMSDSRT